MLKVMIRDNMALVAKEIFESTGKIEVTVDNDKAYNDPEKLSEIIDDYDGICVRSGTKIDSRLLSKTKKLKIIGRAGIGIDNIDVSAATKAGVVVMNAPGGNTVTTAEHAISLMLALARNIPQGTSSIKEGKWEKKQLSGVEITGKTLGIVGLGQIGQIVAQRAKGLMMNVITSDPYISSEAASKLNVERVSFDELLKRSDFITLHVPKLKETTGMIDYDTMKKMKKGVRIINCSRGEVVQLADLEKALEEEHVAGAALDVFPKEPPGNEFSVIQHPRVILTPHLGASTGEAQDKVAEMIANQMSAYLLSGVITNAVNFPSVSKSVMDQLRVHLQLAEKMGALMGQLTRKISDITITYTGQLAKLETKPLTHAILKGFLAAFSHQGINYVNAPSLAAEKGISVKEAISDERHDFSNLIKIKLEGQKEGTDEIWGTVFSQSYPRIVKLGKIYMDAIPEGSMIILENYDKPGVIGNLGTLLGKYDINIGRFQLGRRDDKALCMVNIDATAPDEVIEEILSLPNIISVKQVQLD